MPAQKKTTLFTLHFATINTYNAAISKIVNFTFTLHFATINTSYIVLNAELSLHIYITLCYY